MVLRWTVNFASTRSAQIATLAAREEYKKQELCLHTLRADCNAIIIVSGGRYKLCLHTLRADCNGCHSPGRWGCQPFASTRSAQIATLPGATVRHLPKLCLHTLRADCNDILILDEPTAVPLPPHAPRRLQPARDSRLLLASSLPPHAPRRLQLVVSIPKEARVILCLHTLRADCNMTASRK